MGRISNETKRKRKWGTGDGAEYKPYIITSEFNSLGTTAVITDWKTNRAVHCLSQGEKLWYYILRWDDNNIDIKEQYPLDINETVKIAEQIGVRHPRDKNTVMTTDFLAFEANGSLHAYSIKSDRNLEERTIQKLCIEKQYWINKNAKFDILFKCDVNRIMANNIRIVTQYYDENKVCDQYSKIFHMIAIKDIIVDMSKEIINKEKLENIKEEYGL